MLMLMVRPVALCLGLCSAIALHTRLRLSLRTVGSGRCGSIGLVLVLLQGHTVLCPRGRLPTLRLRRHLGRVVVLRLRVPPLS